MEGMQSKAKNKPSKIEDMTKEQLRQAIIKKRECNAKAQQIVESLLERCIKQDYFLKCIPDINQSHFEDIIEERSILRICGYPLCQKEVSQSDVPKQKYRISIKTNKVYDITVRKSFCSNSCYKSAMHIKKQMLTSPLWFREYEDIPKFHLLPLDSKGSLGQEVDLGFTERIDVKSEKHFTTINDFTNASLNEIDNEKVKITANQIDSCNNKSDSDIHNSSLNNVMENSSTNSDSEKASNINASGTISRNNEEQIKNNIEIKKDKISKTTVNPMNIVGEVIEKPEKKIDPILLNGPKEVSKSKEAMLTKKLPQKKQHVITAITVEVEKCLAEWFTIDTLLFLFGESKVKEMVTDKGECIKEYLNNYARSIFYNSNAYDQYQALCRKLNMLELEDKRYDAQTLSRETKPLPDYSVLKEESKRMQLKVKAFFSGETEVPEIETVEPEPMEEDVSPQLPLVDKNAQNALRRRIVCQHLNKVLPDLLRSLGLLTLTISSDVRLLVNTFKLKANNIMFKPIQWTLIALIFIKLLSLRDPRLKHLLEQPTAFHHLQLLLLSYQQDGGYLDRLIVWLTDVDRLLDVSETQLTIA